MMEAIDYLTQQRETALVIILRIEAKTVSERSKAEEKELRKARRKRDECNKLLDAQRKLT